MKPPEFPKPYYRLKGWSAPWRRLPSWLWHEGYRIEDGRAVSLDGLKSCRAPSDKDGETDAGIMAFLVGVVTVVFLYLVMVS